MIPLPGGTSTHLVGVTLLALLYHPLVAFVCEGLVLLVQALDGEDADPESGVPHEAHIAACCGIILDALMIGRLADDRYKTGKVSGLLAFAKERCAAIRAEFEAKKQVDGSHGKFRKRR